MTAIDIIYSLKYFFDCSSIVDMITFISPIENNWFNLLIFFYDLSIIIQNEILFKYFHSIRIN